MTAEAQTIPEDIMKAAEEALDNLLCNCSESCGGHAGVRKASIEDIAQAILAERERCALVAEGDEKAFDLQHALAEGNDMAVGEQTARLAIARAIRGEA